ncbi:MAG: response regulator transcription factor [Pseudonocardiales bacterium]|nr:response regulator transcription factor [Pseudonocardiales bacterium]
MRRRGPALRRRLAAVHYRSFATNPAELSPLEEHAVVGVRGRGTDPDVGVRPLVDLRDPSAFTQPGVFLRHPRIGLVPYRWTSDGRCISVAWRSTHPRIVMTRQLLSVIRVLVVDDHEVIRDMVSSALCAAADIDVIARCVDGLEACDVAASTRPDVVLMDLSMPGIDGVEATRQILADNPTVRVVILTSAAHGRRANEALEVGAVSCVFKGVGTAEVVRAVRAAAFVA